MPMVQPKEIWEETQRWDSFSEILQKIKNRGGQEFCLGPTHEEVVTDYVRQHVKSYRDLPFNIYQIQTKYRDEFRPRFGLLRAREFSMKDAYSFDLDKKSALASYERMEKAYHNIFSRLGVKYSAVQADSGDIGGDFSKEFHILASAGEDTLLISKDGSYAVNKELAEEKDLKKHDIIECKGIEAGHIFYLGTKYSKMMNAVYLDAQSQKQFIEMGCYGIGLSRIIQGVVEQSHDDNGIIWPSSLSPFHVHICSLGQVEKETQKLYNSLTSSGVECFWDDRSEAPGVKFKDADLMGLPLRLTVGERDLKRNQVEIRHRSSGEKHTVTLTEIQNQVLQSLSS